MVLIDNIIAGYCIGEIVSRGPVFGLTKKGVINAITIDSDFRRRGIADSLLTACENWFRLQGICMIEAFVDSRNNPSLSLKMKHRYVEYQKRMLKIFEKTESP